MIPAFFSKVTPLKPVFRHVDATGQPVNPVYTQTLTQKGNLHLFWIECGEVRHMGRAFCPLRADNPARRCAPNT